MTGPGWAWLRVWPEMDDRMIRSEVGPAGQTREEARAVIEATLDADPALAPLAAIWRRGATDDTVHAGLRVWAVFPHDGDPRTAALSWLADYGDTINSAAPGAVNVVRPPA